MNTIEKNVDKENKYYTVEEMYEFRKKISLHPYYDVDTKLSDNSILNDMNNIYLDMIIEVLKNFSDEQGELLKNFINLFEGNTKYYILNRLIFIYDTEVNSYDHNIHIGKRYKRSIDVNEKTRILNNIFTSLKRMKNPSEMFDSFLNDELQNKTSPGKLFQILLNEDILLFNVGLYVREKLLNEGKIKFSNQLKISKITGRQR